MSKDSDAAMAPELSAALDKVESLMERVRYLERQLEGQRQLIAAGVTPNTAYMLHKKQVMRERRERTASAFAQDSAVVIDPVVFPAKIDTSMVRMQRTTTQQRTERSLDFFQRFSAGVGISAD